MELFQYNALQYTTINYYDYSNKHKELSPFW